jgi:hypothetical protein
MLTTSLKPEARNRGSHLIVLIVQSLGSLVSKASHDGPVAVLKGRLKLEIDPIPKAGSLAIHEERDFDISQPHALDRFPVPGQQMA